MADPFIITALTYLTLVLGAWAGIILYTTGRIMMKAKKLRNKIRTSDKKIFGLTLAMTLTALIVVFVWPGLIYKIPATVAFLGIASIPILWYLTELSVKHHNRLNDCVVTAKK